MAVTDKSRDLPQLREGEPLAESGRGLRLVDAMSTRWGGIPLNWGKQVWAEVGSA